VLREALAILFWNNLKYIALRVAKIGHVHTTRIYRALLVIKLNQEDVSNVSRKFMNLQRCTVCIYNICALFRIWSYFCIRSPIWLNFFFQMKELKCINYIQYHDDTLKLASMCNFVPQCNRNYHYLWRMPQTIFVFFSLFDCISSIDYQFHSSPLVLCLILSQHAVSHWIIENKAIVLLTAFIYTLL